MLTADQAKSVITELLSSRVCAEVPGVVHCTVDMSSAPTTMSRVCQIVVRVRFVNERESMFVHSIPEASLQDGSAETVFGIVESLLELTRRTFADKISRREAELWRETRSAARQAIGEAETAFDALEETIR